MQGNGTQMTAGLHRVRRVAAVLCLAAISALAGLALAEPESADADNPFANRKDAADKGEELFSRNCQPCHNTRGKGGKGPQLVRGAWGPGGANTDLMMYRIIAGGRPGTEMGSFATGLTSDEIWQIITFLRAEARRVKSEASKASEDDNLW